MKMVMRLLLSVNLYNTCLVIISVWMALNYSLILLLIIDVAEIVLNKCMEITGREKQSVYGPAVKFNYDYVDDFAEPETSNSAGILHFYNI